MGLISAQVLKTVTPDVTVLGRHDRKLEIARTLGLTSSLVDGAVEPPASTSSLTQPGVRRGCGARWSWYGRAARSSMKSTFHGEAALPSWPIVVNEVTLVGSRCGPFSRRSHCSRLAPSASGRSCHAWPPCMSTSLRLPTPAVHSRCCSTYVDEVIPSRMVSIVSAPRASKPPLDSPVPAVVAHYRAFTESIHVMSIIGSASCCIPRPD